MRLRSAIRFAAALVAAAAVSAHAQGQGRARLDLAIPTNGDGPTVRSLDMLGDGEIRDLLRNGFPVRLHYRTELWSVSGWFNDLEGSAEWDVIVRYDPLDKSFIVTRLAGERPQVLGVFSRIADANEAAARPYRVPLKAPRKGRRHYYNVVVDVETLSLSDLDEVERWLRGEVRPAVRGRRNPGTALTRGLRTLVVRLLGGERRHYELRSATFRA